MRSVIHDSFGDPAEVLHPADSVRPEPASGEVLVRMRLSPIHNHDLWTVRGDYGYKPTLPAIGGTGDRLQAPLGDHEQLLRRIALAQHQLARAV